MASTCPDRWPGRSPSTRWCSTGGDLARAAGQTYDCDDATARACPVFVHELDELDEGGTPGLFGPSVPVGPGASAFEQVLARSGRDPG